MTWQSVRVYVREMTRNARRGLLVLAASLSVLLSVAGPVGAQTTDDDIAFTAEIAGRDLADVDGNDPLELSAGEVEVTVEIENLGDDPLFVRAVSLEGSALGLDFFGYDVRVDMEIEPGGVDDRTFLLDIGDLEDQAVGLMPTRFTLVGADRQPLASEDLVVDVAGRATSVYGTFGLLVMAATGLLVIGVVYRLVTNRLPRNRWRRGVYFGVPGLGVGLCLTFGLSVLRVLSPESDLWTTLLVAGGIAGFVIGYLTPNPYDEDEEDEDDFDEFEELLVPREPAPV